MKAKLYYNMNLMHAHKATQSTFTCQLLVQSEQRRKTKLGEINMDQQTDNNI